MTTAEINRAFAHAAQRCPSCDRPVGTTMDDLCPACYRDRAGIVDPSTRRRSTR